MEIVKNNIVKTNNSVQFFLKHIPLFCAFCMLLITSKVQAQLLPIIPKPNQVKFLDTKFNYAKGVDIKIIRGDEATKQIASQLNSFLQSRNVKIEKFAPATITINLTKDTTIAKDGYTIQINTNSIALQSSANLGLFYGIQSIKQLFTHDTTKVKNILCAEIADQPQIQYRSLQVDVVSTFFAVEHLKQLIDDMAAIKMNNLHLILAANGINRIDLKSYPVTMASESYKTDELKELIQFAQQRYITLLPQFNFATTTNLLNEDSIQIAKNILDEIISIFPSAYIHIGDESLNSTALATYLSTKNKKAILNSNNLDATTKPNTILISNKNLKSIAAIAPSVILAPKPFAYFDNMVDWEDSKLFFAQQYLPVDKVYKWNPMVMEQNNTNLIGYEAVVPTGYIKNYKELEYQVFPRLYAFQECLWTKKNLKKFSDFEKRLSKIGYPGKKIYKINLVKFK